MKKSHEPRMREPQRRLPLRAETLKRLSTDQLEAARGGNGSCLEIKPDM